MKFKNTLILLLISSSLALAQSNNNFEIIYNLAFQKDSTDIYSVQNEEVILFTNGNTSLFQSYPLYQRDSLMQKDSDNGVDEMTIALNFYKYPTPAFYLKLRKDFKNKKYIIDRQVQEKYYRYTEDFNLEWKIYNDSIKDYHGMKTILATTRMGGRDYKVWFNPNIPIPDGPYKFQGLPGLVVRAIDSDGYFEFNLEAIRKVPEFHYDDYNLSKETIIESTKEEYKKAKEYYDKNEYEILRKRGISFANEEEMKANDKKNRAKNNNRLERE